MIRVENRDGISLVEVIVAMTLLGVVLTSLASATFQASRRSTTLAADTYKQGILMQEVNYLSALPWGSLIALPQNSCRQVSSGNFPHQRCVQVTGSGNARTISVIVTPTDPRARPHTVTFGRANAPAGNPLNF